LDEGQSSYRQYIPEVDVKFEIESPRSKPSVEGRMSSHHAYQYGGLQSMFDYAMAYLARKGWQGPISRRPAAKPKTSCPPPHRLLFGREDILTKCEFISLRIWGSNTSLSLYGLEGAGRANCIQYLYEGCQVKTQDPRIFTFYNFPSLHWTYTLVKVL